MVKIGAVAAYKDKPFFDDMMNTGSLEYFDTYVKINNHYPSLAEQMAKEGGPTSEYNEALGYGLDTIAAFELSHKQLGDEKTDVYKNIALFDAQTQIEAAKAYGVNLKFDELKFLSGDPYGAGKVLNSGYSEIEDKYIEEVMKSFDANLARYLARGALNDDGSITNKDLDGLNWFTTEYPKMNPLMKNFFDSTWHPKIGEVTTVTIADSSIFIPDPRAVSTAPEETKYIIPPGDFKIIVDISNPGDYIKDGTRYIALKGDANNIFGQSGRFTLKDKTGEKIWIYDDKLITTNDLDYIKYEVDGKWWIQSQTHPYYKTGIVGEHYYNFRDLIDIGHDSLVEIAEEGHSSYNGVENPGLDIHIYLDGQEYEIVTNTGIGVTRFVGKLGPFEQRFLLTTDPLEEQRYDKNGKPTFNYGAADIKHKKIYRFLDIIAEKTWPFLRLLNAKYNQGVSPV